MTNTLLNVTYSLLQPLLVRTFKRVDLRSFRLLSNGVVDTLIICRSEYFVFNNLVTVNLELMLLSSTNAQELSLAIWTKPGWLLLNFALKLIARVLNGTSATHQLCFVNNL